MHEGSGRERARTRGRQSACPPVAGPRAPCVPEQGGVRAGVRSAHRV